MRTGAKGTANGADRVRVRLLLFGVFREFANGAELTLDVPCGTTVAGLRTHLKDALALASDSGILPESHAFGGDAEDAPVCLLPPVCGG